MSAIDHSHAASALIAYFYRGDFEQVRTLCSEYTECYFSNDPSKMTRWIFSKFLDRFALQNDDASKRLLERATASSEGLSNFLGTVNAIRSIGVNLEVWVKTGERRARRLSCDHEGLGKTVSVKRPLFEHLFFHPFLQQSHPESLNLLLASFGKEEEAHLDKDSMMKFHQLKEAFLALDQETLGEILQDFSPRETSVWLSDHLFQLCTIDELCSLLNADQTELGACIDLLEQHGVNIWNPDNRLPGNGANLKELLASQYDSGERS